jgi:hypothetical protein
VSAPSRSGSRCPDRCWFPAGLLFGRGQVFVQAVIFLFLGLSFSPQDLVFVHAQVYFSLVGLCAKFLDFRFFLYAAETLHSCMRLDSLVASVSPPVFGARYRTPSSLCLISAAAPGQGHQAHSVPCVIPSLIRFSGTADRAGWISSVPLRVCVRDFCFSPLVFVRHRISQVDFFCSSSS